MDNKFIKQHKILARKNIAKYSKLLKKSQEIDRLKILQAISVEQSILDFVVDLNSFDKFTKIVHNVRNADMAIELPGAPIEDNTPKQISNINFGQLLSYIEKDIKEEESNLESKSMPTQNDLIRWARKWAFLQYYKIININPNQPITKTFGDDKTLRQLSPNKDTIYKLYMEKLEELRRRTDKYRLQDEEFNEALYGGTPQGGSFEKWLERHREDIMNTIYANV